MGRISYKTGLFVILVLLLPLVLGNGINIIQTEINVNKSFQQDFKVKLNVSNEEPFKFYNITFKEDFITVPKFDLNSGETKEIEITITRDTDYSGDITIRGEYQSNVGTSNITEIVTIDYDTGFDKCNLDLIKGDKIIWINTVNGDIDLVNADTGASFLTILEEQNKTYSFNQPEELRYYARWIGFKFTNTCIINILDESGFVHKLEYDDSIPLNLKILYEPTSMTATFLTTNYTIESNKEKSDIFRLENTGTKTAKNIHLSSDWFTFTPNNFDLNAGDSINVGYTIRPLITNTSETNKTYSKKIEIKGNFPTINKNINIFIPYKVVTGLYTGSEVDEIVIQNFIKAYCKLDFDKCIDLFCSIYPDECNEGLLFGNENITQEFSKDTIKSLLENYALSLSEMEDREKASLEKDIEQTSVIEQLRNNTEKLDLLYNELKEESSDNSIAQWFVIIFVLFISCAGVFYVIFIKVMNKDRIKSKFKHHKGEFSY